MYPLEKGKSLKIKENQMKTLTVTVFLLWLLIMPIASVDASVTIKASINQSIYVAIDFENIDNATYYKIKLNGQFDATTIPKLIKKNLEEKNLNRVTWDVSPQTEMYNDTTKSIHVAFYLAGSDIISFTFNKTTIVRIYEVKTEWRKFKVNLTSDYSIDFAQNFGAPISSWRRIDYNDAQGKVHPAYAYEHSDSNSTFYFILPISATYVRAVEDTITFEVPPHFEDILLNSPFMILAALIIIIIVAFVYRRVRT